MVDIPAYSVCLYSRGSQSDIYFEETNNTLSLTVFNCKGFIKVICNNNNNNYFNYIAP